MTNETTMMLDGWESPGCRGRAFDVALEMTQRSIATI